MARRERVATVTSPRSRAPLRSSPVYASDAERRELAGLVGFLAKPSSGKRRRFRLREADGEGVTIPASALEVLVQAAGMLMTGAAIEVVAVPDELTVQQAASVLNVSREFVLKLVDEGRLTGEKKRRSVRLKLREVLSYKRTSDARCRRALRELTRLTESFGGYDRERK